MTAASKFLVRVASGMRLKAGGAQLPILMFHRVLTHADALQPEVLTAAHFDAQMALLARSFYVMPLHEAVPALHAGVLPARAVCITFDDGYRDNFDVALPVLRRHGLTATFFVASGYLDGGCMFNDVVVEALRAAPTGELDLTDINLGKTQISSMESRARIAQEVIHAIKYLSAPKREAFCKALPGRVKTALPIDVMMTREHVRGMVKSGMFIGGHSVTHPILTNISDVQAAAEITDNWATLKDITGRPPEAFAYPNGKPGADFSLHHADMVRKAGYQLAVSTAVGTASKRDSLFSLPRFCLQGQSPAVIGLRLLQMTYFQHQPYTSSLAA